MGGHLATAPRMAARIQRRKASWCEPPGHAARPAARLCAKKAEQPVGRLTEEAPFSAQGRANIVQADRSVLRARPSLLTEKDALPKTLAC